jgi:hypothetical protein
MKKKTWIIIAVIAIASAIAFAFYDRREPAGAGGKQVIKIGVILPLSGDARGDRCAQADLEG